MRLFLVIAFAFVAYADSGKCYALVLGGGGVRGAYEVGALQALTEFLPADQLKYNIISGVSVGAMNSCFCLGFEVGQELEMSKYLLKVWNEIKGRADLYSYWFGFSFFRPAILNTTPMYEFIKKYAGDVIKRNIAAAATNYYNGSYVDFNTSYSIDTLKTACYASGAYPPYFPPVNVLGEWYGDGAMIANANPFEAVEDCRNKGFNDSDIVLDTIYAIPIKGPEPKKINNTRDAYDRFNEVNDYFVDNWYLETARQLYKKVEFRYFIVPKVDFGTINSSPEKIEMIIRTGYNDTKDMLRMNIVERKNFIKDLLDYSYKT